jgi:hypothetical protein
MVTVQLRYAPLPFIGAVAVHYWFVVYEAHGCHRWEVWQTKNAGGFCIGHVHRDLKEPDAGVGGGPCRVAAEWQGDEARSIVKVFENIQNYPYCSLYRYWPGPNSNTFAAWVLHEAGIEHPLQWKAFGRNYRGRP